MGSLTSRPIAPTESRLDSKIGSNKELMQAMSNPRYWRDKDPAAVARVTEGFKKFYNEGDQMNNQKYKTKAMIADDLKRHHGVLKAEFILSIIGMVVACFFVFWPVFYIIFSLWG